MLVQVFAVSSRPQGQRAVLKFAHFTGTTAVAGRFTPGTFTNHAQRGFREPRLLIVTDPLADHQAIFESAYANVPVVAFCNTDARLKYVDVAVPCNTKSVYAIGLMWWLLTREVLRLRGQLTRAVVWPVVPDLYFYRDPEELAREAEMAAAEAATATVTAGLGAMRLNVEAEACSQTAAESAAVAAGEKWPDMFKVADWNEEVLVDTAAQKANTVSAATWGAENGLF